MHDLATQLREYVEATAPPVELEEILSKPITESPVRPIQPRVPPPPGRRGLIYAVPAAAAVLLVAGVAAALFSLAPVADQTGPAGATVESTLPSPPSTVPPTPSTAPSGPDPSLDDREPFLADSVVGQWTWTPVDGYNAYGDPGGFAGGRFYHSGATSARHGHMFRGGTSLPIDVSEDGLTWFELAGPTSNSRLANYRGGVVSDMLVAYTIDVTSPERSDPASRGEVSLWRYESGSWAEFASPVELVGEIDDVIPSSHHIFVDVVGPYVVVSSRGQTIGFGDGWMLVSKDGASFAPADLPAPGIETWPWRQLVSLNGGLLALLDQDQLWGSDNGLTWTQIEPSGVDLAGIPGGEEERVFLIGGNDRVFLLGRETTWTSPDGRTWEATDLPSNVQSVWRAPFGWVAFAGAGWSDASGEWHRTGTHAQVFVSTDGVTWNTIEAPPATCYGSFVADTLFTSNCGEGRWEATWRGD